MKIKIICCECRDFIILKLIEHDNSIGWYNDPVNHKRVEKHGWSIIFIGGHVEFYCPKCKKDKINFKCRQ